MPKSSRVFTVLSIFLVLLVLAAAFTGNGSGISLASAPLPSSPLWQDQAESGIVHTGNRDIVPSRYRLVGVNETALASLLGSAPLETGNTRAQNSFAIISLPMPDGSFQRFSFVEAPVIEAQLAAQYPMIKTYVGQGLDDRTATARFDHTQFGFHAMVIATSGTTYIDPYQRGDTLHYISYLSSDTKVAPGDRLPELGVVRSHAIKAPTQPFIPIGTQLRTYRLALAATGEYTIFYGGTIPLALAGMTTSVNRVVGVYEREVAVRMVLIANETSIIYTNPATDPYTNNDGFAMLGENQSNLDSVIGNANYDIGHVFSTGGGGVAELGAVCITGEKAQGVTGSPSPTGDGFDIDYVAHEMGHQFGANHTFNGTTSNCGGGNREASDAYEPGSGSTIMAYAGICGGEDLQPHSDPYFHVDSIDEIVTYTQSGSGNACAAISATGNLPPTANAGVSYTIPISTPFKLVGSGTDPDGDPVTYNWEEFDLGAAAPPNTDNGNRPIFRSFNAVTVPYRFIPKLANILSNTLTFGEAYQTTTRALKFRITVRDNRAGGGGVNYAQVTINSNNTAGPFAITSQNTAVTWTGGTNENVTWNVANTTAAPVSCPNVDITLSTNGGASFDTTLVAGTPNDGTQSITVPSLSSTTARVMVACSNNIFLDINNANFTIVPGGAATSTPTTPAATPTTPPATPTTPPATATNPGATATTPPEATATPTSPEATATNPPEATATPTSPEATATNPPEATATPTVCSVTFTDVPTNSTFYAYIHCLACLDIVSGYADGTFHPENNVTRGQLSKIVSNSAGWDDSIPADQQSFQDVAPASTFWVFIERMFLHDAIGGYPCGRPGEPCGTPPLPYFRPGNNATRGQISKIVVLAAGLPIDITGGPHFSDVASGDTFYDEIETLFNAGAITGYADGTFRPSNNASRGQTAKIVSLVFFPNCIVSAK